MLHVRNVTGFFSQRHFIREPSPYRVYLKLLPKLLVTFTHTLIFYEFQNLLHVFSIIRLNNPQNVPVVIKYSVKKRVGRGLDVQYQDP